MSRPTRAVRIARGGILPPWNVATGELTVLGVPLRERQDRALSAIGLRFEAEQSPEEARKADTLYVDDDVDVSIGALVAWLKHAAPGTAMALTERPRRVGELEVEPQVWFRDGELVERDIPGASPARVVGVSWGEAARPVRVPPLGFSGKGKLPGPFGGDAELEWAIDVRTAVTVRHWVHLLRAQLAALGVEVWTKMLLRPWSLAWTWMRYPLRRHTSIIGRACKIHPTASLEGCILEDGVTVGPYSTLKGCWIGKGATVEDHVTSRLSVIGRNSHVANYSMFNLSVLGERSSVGHIGGQACVIGCDTFVSTFATLQDLNLRGNVKVWMDGKLRDSGVPFLGVAVGNGVKLGSGVTIAPGRMVANGVRIWTGDALTRLPVDLAPGDYTAAGGKITREGGTLA